MHKLTNMVIITAVWRKIIHRRTSRKNGWTKEVNWYQSVDISTNLLYVIYHWSGPVGWGCRIHWLHLCKGIRYSQRVSWYDIKQSDGEVPVMMELWGIRSTLLMASFPGSRWHGVVEPDGVQSMDRIELNSVFILNWIVWNRIVLTFKLCTYAKLNRLK